MMTSSHRRRLAALEGANSDPARALLVAIDAKEAARLHKSSPGALVVVTGVARASVRLQRQ